MILRSPNLICQRSLELSRVPYHRPVPPEKEVRYVEGSCSIIGKKHHREWFEHVSPKPGSEAVDCSTWDRGPKPQTGMKTHREN